jgi:hypothetical protein
MFSRPLAVLPRVRLSPDQPRRRVAAAAEQRKSKLAPITESEKDNFRLEKVFYRRQKMKKATSHALVTALALLSCVRASSPAFAPALVEQLLFSHAAGTTVNKEEAEAAASVNDTLVTVTLAPGQYLLGKQAHAGSGWHFLGIPYAAPPVGALRWRTPQAPARWAGVRKALDFGASCMQSPGGAYNVGSGAPSEDCLFLNVYAPPPPAATAATAAAEEGGSTPDGSATGAGGWPVLVFFHGGSWESGSGACPLYYGGQLVGNTNAVVVVTVNYRLSTFGFLGGDALRDPSDGGSTGERREREDQAKPLQLFIGHTKAQVCVQKKNQQ